MKEKILLTGSCGFLIGNLLRKIVYEKIPYNISSLDRVNNKNSMYWNKNHTFHVADVIDEHCINSILEIEQPDIVIHGAGYVGVENSFKESYKYIETNVLGTQNIINACLNNNVKKFIYLSTDSVYNARHADESSANFTNNPYAASKLAAETLIKSSELNYNILRISNLYGPRQRKNFLIPKTIKSILEEKDIEVYGDGSITREWTHVFDANSAILKILENWNNNEIYNVSSNQEFSNIEIVQKICKVMNKGFDKIKFIEDPIKNRNIEKSINSTKIKQLGWQSQYKIKNINETIDWYINNSYFLK